MGFLSNIFSGRSGRLASMATAQQLAGTQAQAQQLLQQGKTDALGALDAAQPLSLAALRGGQDKAIGAIDAGQPLSLAALGAGYDRAGASLNEARDMYTPYATTGAKGFNLYADALGVNGPGGNTNAVGAFHAGPGYQWSVDQATDALARKAGAMGLLGSGNTMTAISDRAGHMADQEYGNWLTRLQGLGGTGYNAITAQADITGRRAGMEAQRGVGEAGIFDANGRLRSSLYDLGGQREAGIIDTNAGRRAGIHTGSTALGVNSLLDLGRQMAANTNAGMTEGSKASANTLNASLAALLGLASVAGRMKGGSLPAGSGGV